MPNNKKSLGRGLESLFAIYDEDATKETSANSKNADSGVEEVELSKIRPNPNQPRKTFDQNALQELADSIKLHGIIQPLVVNDEGGHYMIIAGERRYRAAQIAGLTKVPVIIKNYTEKQVKEIALIENLQREDLNPIEAARAIRQLMDEYNLTQETVSERIGKSRSSIANTLRLLTLTPEVIKLIEDGKISAGHARALIVIDDPTQQIALAKQAAAGKITVRDIEKIVKDLQNPNKVQKKKLEVQSLELKELVIYMQRTFSTKVSAIGNDNKGRIYIDYYSRDDLDRISDLLDLVNNKRGG